PKNRPRPKCRPTSRHRLRLLRLAPHRSPLPSTLNHLSRRLAAPKLQVKAGAMKADLSSIASEKEDPIPSQKQIRPFLKFPNLPKGKVSAPSMRFAPISKIPRELWQILPANLAWIRQ